MMIMMMMMMMKLCRDMSSQVENGFLRVKACRRDSSVASVEMFTLKVAASLVVGVAGGLWMCSAKSCRLWTSCLSRLGSRLTTGDRRGRTTTNLVRPVVSVGGHDSRPDAAASLPAATGVRAVAGASLYSALDGRHYHRQSSQPQPHHRGDTMGRRTGASLTTIL